MFATFDLPVSWGEVLKRTAKETKEDDCLGLAAQLAYFLFLALFPALLFLLALASFFPLTSFSDELVRTLSPVAPPDVLHFLEEQLRQLARADSGGVLTLGIMGALWSSSAAMVAIMSTMNRAYDINEARPWWKVRLTAIGLTCALAVLIVVSLTLIVVGPTLAERVADSLGLGAAFEWSWKILQWPVAFFLASTALGLVYYYAPDAEQDWAWITPGALVATLLWVAISLGFKLYVAHFTDYNAAYGTVGAVIVLLLWFYVSGLAILVGAELNAEIEHASPHGKNPGEKVPGQKRKIGLAAARAYRDRLEESDHTSTRNDTRFTMSTHTDRSLGEMFADLLRETGTLVEQEMRLAKIELADALTRVRSSATLIAVGGFLAYAGLLASVASVVLALIEFGLPAWAAALLGGGVVAGVGYLLIRMGLATLRKQQLTPRHTLETVKEDARWLESQTR